MKEAKQTLKAKIYKLTLDLKSLYGTTKSLTRAVQLKDSQHCTCFRRVSDPYLSLLQWNSEAIRNQRSWVTEINRKQHQHANRNELPWIDFKPLLTLVDPQRLSFLLL